MRGGIEGTDPIMGGGIGRNIIKGGKDMPEGSRFQGIRADMNGGIIGGPPGGPGGPSGGP